MDMNTETQSEEKEEFVAVELEEDQQDNSIESSEEETSTIVQDSSNENEPSEDLENYSDNVKKRINQLTAKRKQALEEAEAAYTYAQQVQQQNEDMKKRLSDLDKGYINEYGTRVESQEASVKKVMQEAYDSGDMAKVADAQSALSQLAIEKERLRVQKARSEKNEQEVQAQPESPVQRRQPVQEQDLDPKLKKWMSQNSWFGQNMVMSKGAEAIHEQLVGQEDFDPSSDEYYQEIDKRMREHFPQKFQEQRNNAQSVTPASSGRSATKNGRKKTTVQLNQGQVQFCKKMGIKPEDYAKEIVRLERRNG